MTAVTSDALAGGFSFRRPSRSVVVLGIVVGWVLLYLLLKDKGTLVNGQPTDVVQVKLLAFKENVDAGRNTNPLFVYGFNNLRQFLDTLFVQVQTQVTSYGWTGPTAVAGALALMFANWRVAILAVLGFLSFGVLGLWAESMDTLALTLTAVVLSLVVGIPLGVWAGVSRRFNSAITPLLDFMQILPTFAYLPLITLFFLIGPASAVVATIIYALPPVIRLTAVGIREVSASTVEAATSLGSTPWQRLRQVQLPMAKKTIVLGVNQTTMAALSMVTIAALIDAPGLGKVVLQALETLNIGVAFTAGLAIVIMAIVFDRTTTAASQRTEGSLRAGRVENVRVRRITGGMAVVVAVVMCYIGQTYVAANTFPDNWVFRPVKVVNDAAAWVELNLFTYTDAIKNFCTTYFIDPLQALLTQSPWWLVIVALAALALLLAGWRVAVVVVLCLGGIIGMGLWYSSMFTLASVLVGAVIVMVLGTAVGVWAGRSRRVEQLLRPILDAGQTMPAFVYLPPCLALFGSTRFTGIIAAVVYAAPAVVKVVIEGIRGVSETSMEAATSSGSNRWQIIGKVQLPMARPHLLLAFNQGVIYVLAMVVVGGLVGSEGLGLDVIRGFSQTALAGVGLAAGLCIVLLGVMLDRVTQGAGRVRISSDGH